MEGADAPVAAEETAEDVLAAAAAAGHNLSRDQLIRFHQHGLIPRPRQAHPRPDGGRGSATLYPAGTAALVVRICELRRDEQRFEELGWLAWWNGLEVPDRLARDYLNAQMAEIVSTKDELLTSGGQITDKASDALDAAPDVQLSQMLMRWVRRRVGTDSFDQFLELLLMVVAGRTNEFTPEDLQLLEHGIGLDRARTDTLATTGAPWLDSDPRTDFQNISDRIQPDALQKALDGTSDDQLRQARDMAKSFTGVISNLGQVLRETGDRWSFGFAAFGAFFDDMVSIPPKQAQFLLFLLSCVSADGTEGIDQIIDQQQGVAGTAFIHEALKALRNAVPEVAEAIPLNMFGKAMKDSAYQEQVLAKIAELRATCGDKMDAFFAANPQYRPADDA